MCVFSSCSHSLAYRLASIGLVGNLRLSTRITCVLVICLPIGFDWIRWKPFSMGLQTILTSQAYRLASIGFTIDCANVQAIVFIGSAIGDGLVFGMEGRSGPTQKSRSNEGVIGQT